METPSENRLSLPVESDSDWNKDILGKLLDILLERLLVAFADTDEFIKEESPTFFLVYAHDNPDAGTAHATLVRGLIRWFEVLRSKVLSDRSISREPWTTREDINSGRDILSNQFCLLPKDSESKNVHKIGRVDKVILCCSEVLQKYYEDRNMKAYLEALKNTYLSSNKALKNSEEIKLGIENIVREYLSQPGFHHVLTELAFLEIRCSQDRKQHGVIPIVLDQGRIPQFLDAGVPLEFRLQKFSGSMIHDCQILHRLFFNLLRQLYDYKSEVIGELEQCYKKCVDRLSECVNHVSGSRLPSTEIFEHWISLELGKVLDRLNRHRIGIYRTVPGKFNVTFDLKNMPNAKLFTGRKAELDLMETQLTPGKVQNRRKICIIHGLGGIGKSQLAIEYARSQKTHYTSFFWLNGNTESLLIDSLIELSKRLPKGQIAIREVKGLEETRKRAKEVLEWFSREGNERWLLVYDNIDKTLYGEKEPRNSEHPSLAYNIKDYFPDGDTGSIIITTRLQRLVSLGSEVKLGKLEILDSLVVLENYAGKSFKSELHKGRGSIDTIHNFDNAAWDPEAIVLVKKLGFLPLALVFAGSLLRTYSIAKYLHYYDKSWKELHGTKDQATNPRECIVTTWNISFDDLNSRNPEAASLVRLCGYFNNSNLWYQLFGWQGYKNSAPSWLRKITASEIAFNDAINSISNYSLVDMDIENDSFSIHPVVHHWIRESVNINNQQCLLQIATTTLGLAVPMVNVRDSWEIQRRLLPHTDFLLQYWMDAISSRNGEDQAAYLAGLSKLGDLYRYQGKIAEAEQMFQRALKGYEKALGPDHPKYKNIAQKLQSLEVPNEAASSANIQPSSSQRAPRNPLAKHFSIKEKIGKLRRKNE